MVTNKNLIGISGRSGSGKDLVANLIKFIFTQYELHGQIHSKFDPEEMNYAYINKWETHRFADKLKQIVSLLTGISREDLEKEEVKSSNLDSEWDWIHKVIQLPNRHWIYIPGIVHESMQDRARKRTVREFLQLLGTDACRNVLHENIWVNALFTDYKTVGDVWIDMPYPDRGVTQELSPAYPKWIIPDLRFKNEFQAIKNRGGLTIRIDRDYDKKNPKFNHQSETDLDDYRDKFDYIIDNNSSIEMLTNQVKTILLLEEII